MEDLQKYYLVTNVANRPCTYSWNLNLLSDEDLKLCKEYMQTSEYLGEMAEDVKDREKTPVPLKLEPFYQSLNKDLQIKSYVQKQNGGSVIRQAKKEWVFCIGPDYKKILKENDIYDTRELCSTYGIRFTADEEVKGLVEKLKEKLGDNKRVLTERQWLNSGLKDAFEKKEIRQRSEAIRYGMDGPKVMYSGFLEAKELSPDVALMELTKEDKE